MEHTDYYANQVAVLPAGSGIARNSTGRILLQMSPFSSVSYCLPSHSSHSFPEVRAMISYRLGSANGF